jgi:tetratricopeptide (TPR) repeat protein
MTDSAAADISRAEMLINQALAASPRDPFAHFVKGQIRREQGRYEEATTEYESVLASNRNSSLALLNIGRCRFLTGSLDGRPLMGKPSASAPRSRHRSLAFIDWTGASAAIPSRGNPLA